MSTLCARAAVVSLTSVRTAAQPFFTRLSLVSLTTLASKVASVLGAVAADAGPVPMRAPPTRAVDIAARAAARRRRLVMPQESVRQARPEGRDPVGTDRATTSLLRRFHPGPYAGLSQSAPSGGTVSATDTGWPCHCWSSVSTRPRL